MLPRPPQFTRSDTRLPYTTLFRSGGFTEPRGSRKQFGALILGVYQEGQLEYIGHTGGGFSQASLQAVHRKMLPLVSAECPFRSEEHTSELQSLMRNSYAVFCLNKTNHTTLPNSSS